MFQLPRSPSDYDKRKKKIVVAQVGSRIEMNIQQRSETFHVCPFASEELSWTEYHVTESECYWCLSGDGCTLPSKMLPELRVLDSVSCKIIT